MILLQCNYNVYMPPVHTGVLKCSSFSTNWQQWYMLYEDQCTARSRDLFWKIFDGKKDSFLKRMLFWFYWFGNVKYFLDIWTCFKDSQFKCQFKCQFNSLCRCIKFNPNFWNLLSDWSENQNWIDTTREVDNEGWSLFRKIINEKYIER